MTDKVIVRRTITEHTNGRKQDPNSPTGWVRRTGAKQEGFVPEYGYKGRGENRRLQPTGLYKRVMEDVWEPCEAPRTTDCLAEDRPKGGTINTVIEWPDGVPSNFESIFIYADWKAIVGALLYRRSMTVMRYLGEQDEEKVAARIAEQRSQDRLLERLGVDIDTLRKYDEV